jgi:hypothetical protein
MHWKGWKKPGRTCVNLILIIILCHVDPLLGNAHNIHMANNTRAVFSVACAWTNAMERTQLMHVQWRHTKIEEVMQAGVFCRSAPRLCFLLWSVLSGYKRHGRSFESVKLKAPACHDETRSKGIELRGYWVQVSSDLKVSLWREDSACNLETLCVL